MKTYTICLAASLFAVSAFAQSTNPLIAETKQGYDAIKNNLTKAAEAMPEDGYSFKATPDVRTFGALIAHIADSQARSCGAVTGDMKPSNAASKTSKADLVAALKDSFAACDGVWSSLTDANATEMVKWRGNTQRSKLGVLIATVVHDNEEYGYLAVYMRLKNVVPPSSDRR